MGWSYPAFNFERAHELTSSGNWQRRHPSIVSFPFLGSEFDREKEENFIQFRTFFSPCRITQLRATGGRWQSVAYAVQEFIFLR